MVPYYFLTKQYLTLIISWFYYIDVKREEMVGLKIKKYDKIRQNTINQ